MTVRDAARQLLDRALVVSPAQSIYRRKAQQSLAVLAYHKICDPENFRRQMEYVSECLAPVTLADVISAGRNGQPLPAGAVLVTFDDGHVSLLEHGLPTLQELRIPAVAFIIAGMLGTDEPFWWDEAEELWSNGGWSPELQRCRDAADVTRKLKCVSNQDRLQALDNLRRTATQPALRQQHLQPEQLAELEACNIAIGNHTLSHPCLHQCNGAQIGLELEQSQRILQEALGHAPRAMAYPNSDADPRVSQAVAESGFEIAFLFDHSLSENPPKNLLRVSRLRVSAETSLDRFRIVVSGLHPRIHNLLGRT